MTEKTEQKQFIVRIEEELKEWIRTESFNTRASQAEIVRVALNNWRKENPAKRKETYDRNA